MKTPHKHAELIHAWADGAEIEFRTHETIQWHRIYPGWSWENTGVAEYRIKPEPRPDVFCYARILMPYWDAPPRIDGLGYLQGCLDNLKLTFDGETGKLKSAEVV